MGRSGEPTQMLLLALGLGVETKAQPQASLPRPASTSFPSADSAQGLRSDSTLHHGTPSPCSLGAHISGG